MKRNLTYFSVAILVIVSLASIGLYYYLSQEDLGAGDAEAASTLALVQTSPAAGTDLQQGDTVIVELQVNLPEPDPGDNPSVGEIAITYDPAILNGTNIVVSDDTLKLLDKIDNTNGKMSVDIAKVGQQGFEGNRALVIFTFKLVKDEGATTQVNIDPTTTFGYPNIYDGTGQNLTMILDPDAISLALVQGSPTAGTDLRQGDTVTVELKTSLPDPDPGDNPNVGEIAITYDPAILNGTNIAVLDDTILLLDTIDNTNGKMSADIARIGQQGFEGDRTLAILTFSLIKDEGLTTQVNIDAATTFGAPNVYDGTGQNLTMTINLDTSYCGDGRVQTPNDDGVNEVCDDGNNSNNDQCSSDCLNACSSPSVWDGSQCSCPEPSCKTCPDNSQVCKDSSNNCSYPVCPEPPTYCGDGIVQTPNSEGVNEVCDDGNNSNNDFCSEDCLNACTDPLLWDGAQCSCSTPTCMNCDDGSEICKDPSNSCQYPACPTFAQGCNMDRDKNGTVDLEDFGIFAFNYKKNGIDCSLNITNDDCYLDISDLSIFAKIYLQTDACKPQ